MTEICRKKYANSPLLEVVCEINFSDRQDDPTIPGYFHQLIEKDFPLKQKGIRYVLEVESNDTKQELTERDSVRFSNPDQTKFVQISDGVLIINFNGQDYQSYENFAQSVLKIFSDYQKIGESKEIERLRLRYINIVQIPFEKNGVIELSDYYNYYPHIEENHYGFKMQFELPAHYPNHEIFVQFSSLLPTIISESENPVSNFILDISSLIVHDNEASIEVISKILKEAHENVGRVFEKFLTDKTRELLKEVKHDTCSW